jgi:AraC family transcriptional regulator, arabinose operon regulatory protein
MAGLDANMSYIDISPSTPCPAIVAAAQANCGGSWTWDSKNQMHWKGFNLWFVAGGRGTLQVEGETYALTAGDCFLLRMWERHRGKNGNAEILRIPWVVFNFLDKRGKSLTPEHLRRLPPRHRRINNIAFFSGLMERIIRCRDNGETEGARFWLNAALKEMELQDAEIRKKAEPDPLSGAFRALAARLSENPGRRVPVSAQAGKAGYSTDHFIRLFKSRVGMTPGEYLIQARIAAACNRLLMSDAGLSVISEELGYSDPFAFCKQFKLKTGLSPTRYRRQGAGARNSFHA